MLYSARPSAGCEDTDHSLGRATDTWTHYHGCVSRTPERFLPRPMGYWRGRGQRAQALTSGNLKSSWADSPEKYLHMVHRGHALTKGVRK